MSASGSGAPSLPGGLTQTERRGFGEMLLSLDPRELLSLADTVTNRLLSMEGPREAINAILSYSQSAEELLRRRKLRRETIFQYLAKHNVIVPATAEKCQLVQRVVEYWREGLNVSQKNEVAGNIALKPDESKTVDYQAMGLQFSHWFYQLLNSQSPLMGEQPKEWGPQHFWEDSELKFAYKTSEEQVEAYHGAEMVSLRLLALTKDENLFLNPNLSGGGLKCIHSPHGLVIIAVAGTIHRESICLGIFEQIFGLIRCPNSDNNWKMKFISLKITGHNTQQTSIHPDKPLQLPMIKYESSELLNIFEDVKLG
ncbi:uncharacterized protein C3orf38 [Callorhinchus milii]|uniref:uncharacterized protein C3orf38 n=1 Tax=Callorhinchus milii TaxID=7868 RepID=UPI001C3F89EA|nr:uncharacterized protein C3orf38 [Callorhinchus milii]